jgi:hypothetical protein
MRDDTSLLGGIMDDRRDLRAELEQQNAKMMGRELDDLENGHWDNFRMDYKGFWDHVRRINDLFRTTKPFSQSDWVSLHDRQQDIIARVKHSQQEADERLEMESRSKREDVFTILKNAHFHIYGQNEPEMLNKARDLLEEVKELMKNGWPAPKSLFDGLNGLIRNEGRMTRDDRQACWDRYKEISQELYFRRQELRSYEYEALKREAWDLVNNLSEDNARETLGDVRSMQQRVKTAYLIKPHRAEIFEILQRAYEEACEILKSRREERQKKHEAWVERSEGLLEKWQTALEKNEAFAERMEDHLSNLYDKLSEATSEGYRQRVEGWIDDAQEKRSSALDNIRSLQEKIASVKEKLDG